MRIFIILWTLFMSNGSDALRLSITPEKSIATTEESAQVSCTTNVKDVNAGEITVIEIYRNDEAPLAVLRHCSEITLGTNTASRFQALGKIDNETGNGFLNLTLANPASEDTGIYTCVVYYLHQDGTMKEQKASGNMVVENLDVKTLENVLNTMKNKIALLEGRQDEMKETDSLILDMMDVMRRNQSQKISDLEDKARFTTAFSAANKNKEITSSNGKILILPDVIMRMGQGYNETTGIFTATREGIYVFHVVVTERSSSGMHMDLRKNEEVLARLYAYENISWDQSSISSVTHLKPGDQVFSVMRTGSRILRHQLHTVFTGYLIQPF